jgi:HlyD family secretion protein
MKKKVVVIVAAAIVVIAAVIGLVAHILSSQGESTSTTKAYVTSVSDLMGTGTLGTNVKLTGIVEPQKEVKVKKDDSKKISKLYVLEGDEVKKGDKLFEYDVDDIQISLEQAELERDTITQKIETLNSTLEEYKKQKSSATDQTTILEATINIQSTELDIKTEEYNKTEKEQEIEKIKKSLENTVVTADIDGIVKSVASSSTSASGDTSTDSSSTYITILALGNYRVKGTVSELNRGQLTEGESVIIRSRANTDSTWKATITSVSNQQDSTSSNSDVINTGTAASTYTFYAELESMDGLVLGQHVYVEPDTSSVEDKEGVWISSSYISYDEDGNAYVWKTDEVGNKLSKTTVELGEYEESSDLYEIKSGISESDYLAYPMEIYTEGMGTTTNYTESVEAQSIDDSTDSYDDTEYTEDSTDTATADEEVVG